VRAAASFSGRRCLCCSAAAVRACLQSSSSAHILRALPLPRRQVTGSFTISSPRNGLLTSVTVNGTGGACAAPVCDGATALVANKPMVCRYSCASSVTSVVPSFSVDGYSVTGAAVTVTTIRVDGDTACITLTDPVLKEIDPVAWGADKKVCYNSAATAFTVDVRSRTPAPRADQCLACAPSYTLANTALISTFGLNASLGLSDVVATLPCAPCTVVATLNGTITRNWEW
jgi:hypothetical protein